MEERKRKAKELLAAIEKLAFQNEEKEKRAAELIIANKELAYQNEEKEKREAELIIANNELAYQNEEKEKREAELIIANNELAYQNEEKEKRAAELIIANNELAFQNEEKEKRAAELIIANEELAFQNEEKEKRAAELSKANKELLAFTFVSSHDLQEPLRKIQTFASIILENDAQNLSESGQYNFQRIQAVADRMQQLIDDLLAFSRINTSEDLFEKVDLTEIIEDIRNELEEKIEEANGTIDTDGLVPVNVIPFQFRQLLYNLISNALKFADPKRPSLITVSSRPVKGSDTKLKLPAEKEYNCITVQDNGIGFESKYSERIFGVFQKLHGKEVYAGTGIGLAIVKKVVDNHDGALSASGELGKGAKFEVFIPVKSKKSGKQ